MELNIRGHHFLLLKEKAVFWAEQSTLLISDVHLGKIMHFRKEGIAVPDIAFLHNFQQLEDLLFLTSADRIIFLGDLFHNTVNREWLFFSAWRKRFAGIRIQVVRGNHDILPDQLFADLDIEMIDGNFEQDGFLFTHHPLTEPIPGLFAFAGHIHPVFRLYAKARQELRLPCFVVDPYQAILPGFGVFTGGYEIDQVPGRSVFVIGGAEVFHVAPPSER